MRDTFIILLAFFATFIVAVCAFYIFFDMTRDENLAQLDALDALGSFASGLFSSIALIWVCAALIMQTKELKLQRSAHEHMIKTSRSEFILGVYDRIVLSISADILQLVTIAGDEISDMPRQLPPDLAPMSVLLTAANSRDLAKFVEYSLKHDSQVVVAIVAQFCSGAKSLETITKSDGVPNELSTYLYDQTPIRSLHIRLSSELRKLTGPDEDHS